MRNEWREGDTVYFLPAYIGYGYDYGTDIGIPATVVSCTATRVSIVFNHKDGTPIRRRVVVSPRNLSRRLAPPDAKEP